MTKTLLTISGGIAILGFAQLGLQCWWWIQDGYWTNVTVYHQLGFLFDNPSFKFSTGLLGLDKVLDYVFGQLNAWFVEIVIAALFPIFGD